MKAYSELNTEELVRANLAGSYDDIVIDAATCNQNLLRLIPALSRQIDEYQETYEQAQGDPDPTVSSWVKWVDSLRELLVRAEKVVSDGTAKEGTGKE